MNPHTKQTHRILFHCAKRRVCYGVGVNNTQYKTQEEWLGIGQAKGYISIIKDSSEIKYNSASQHRALKEKEKSRAVFLVQLIEKYSYPEVDIQIDVEVKNSTTIDILVYKDNKPFIAVDIDQPDTQKTFAKAKELKARYIAIINKENYQFFVIPENPDLPPKPIINLPNF